MEEMIEPKIPDIEQELSRLWDAREDKNQLKACLFTLVIYANEKQRGKYYQEIVQAILEQFPCRIIFIKHLPQGSSPTLKVTVANQLISKSGGTIVCDQITVETTKEYLERVPYLILPHLIPDLPMYLIWAQDPGLDANVLKTLSRNMKRVIVDPESSDSISSFCKSMIHTLSDSSKEMTDYSWALNSGWREAFGHVFDTKEKIEQLKRAQAITIYFNSRPSEYTHFYDMQALFLQGWLATQLDFEFISQKSNQTTRHFSYTFENRPIKVILAPKESLELFSAAIVQVDIQIDGNIEYQLVRKLHPSKIEITVSSERVCDLPFSIPLPDMQKGHLLMHALFFAPSGKNYKKMLETLSKMRIS